MRLRAPPVADEASKTKRRGRTTHRAPSECVFGHRKRAKTLLCAEAPRHETDTRKLNTYRGIAQLVEHRSPKPSAEGSSPSAPAMKET